MSLAIHDRVASLVLDEFGRLPPKCKPRIYPNGKREWTPLAAIVLSKGDELQCISIATGTKCLPTSTLPHCQGAVLHDSHAEILALRGLNRWLLYEIRLIVKDRETQSDFLEKRLRDTAESIPSGSHPSLRRLFRLRDDVSFYMFATVAPCGDASMELLMQSMAPDDIKPWSPAADADSAGTMLGRGQFSELGRVRRKPSRADAEPSLSKSCSDKLTIKQSLSLLSFPIDLFIQETDNTFLKSLIVYAEQFNRTGYSRAFQQDGRLAGLQSGSAKYFDIQPLAEDFPRFSFEKGQNDEHAQKVSNSSMLWIQGSGRMLPTTETYINGVREGFKQLGHRPAKESMVCRKRIWLLARDIASTMIRCSNPGHNAQSRGAEDVAVALLHGVLSSPTYGEAKSSQYRSIRQSRKGAITRHLGGWIQNTGDDDWGIEININSRRE